MFFFLKEGGVSLIFFVMDFSIERTDIVKTHSTCSDEREKTLPTIDFIFM